MARSSSRRGVLVPLAAALPAALALALAAAVPARADEALLAGPDDDASAAEALAQVEDPDEAGSPALPGDEPTGDALAAALDDYLSRSLPATGVPGVAVAVVDADGVRYEATLGDCEGPDDTFLIGSLSKSVTAVAVMQLVERGLVDLDAPVGTYVAGTGLPDDVTVRSLLNQTSGIGYYDTVASASAGETLGSFSYANANYDLLGRVVEEASGRDYASYVEDCVFAPLGMDEASADGGGDAPEAPGHRCWFGVPVADGFEHGTGDDAWGGPASGYVRASLSDMESYLRMYLNSGEGALEPGSVHQMVYSRVSDPAGDTFYGMGWTTYTWGDGELVMSHDGQVENYVARMCVIPGRSLAVVVLGDANDEFGGNEAFFSMADGVSAIAVGAGAEPVDGAARVSEHVACDAAYLVALLLAAVPLALALARRGRGRPHVAASLVLLAGPACLLCSVPLGTGMRWRDFCDFYPDQALVIIACALLLLAGGATRLAAARSSRRVRVLAPARPR